MSRTKQTDEYRLWQHSNGTYYIVTGSGNTKKRYSCGTKARGTAEEFRSQFIAAVQNPPAPKTAPVKYYLDRYYDDVGKDKRSAAVMRSNIKYLKPHFGNLLPEQITQQQLRQYAKIRQQQGVGNGTILRAITTLKLALKYAASNRWIAPLPPLPNPVPASQPRDIWLTRDEVRRMQKRAALPHIALFILLAASTGARTSAILELRWERVDLERGIIHFGKGWGNKRRAIAPMNDDLRLAMQQAADVRTTDFVIEFNSKPIKSVRRSFNTVCKAEGIIASPHVMRHTAATWMVMDGVPISEVARLLGTNERTVERVYGKHAPDYLRRAVSALRL